MLLSKGETYSNEFSMLLETGISCEIAMHVLVSFHVPTWGSIFNNIRIILIGTSATLFWWTETMLYGRKVDPSTPNCYPNYV